MKLTIAALALATSEAAPLTCNYSNNGVSCQTKSMGTIPYADQQCTTDGHTCLSADWGDGVIAAFGCYPNDVVAGTKSYYETVAGKAPAEWYGRIADSARPRASRFSAVANNH